MAKKKCPAELNSKVVRINIGDYAWLAEISRHAGITFAEALHLALERQEPELEPELEPDLELEPVASKSPRQIPMLITSARSMPVTSARSTPITVSFSRRGKTNGHK